MTVKHISISSIKTNYCESWGNEIFQTAKDEQVLRKALKDFEHWRWDKGLPGIRRFEERSGDRRARGFRILKKKVRQMLTREG